MEEHFNDALARVQPLDTLVKHTDAEKESPNELRCLRDTAGNLLRGHDVTWSRCRVEVVFVALFASPNERTLYGIFSKITQAHMWQ